MGILSVLMTDEAKKLLGAVLDLSPEDRAHLAREIISSLDEPRDEGAEAAWLTEIERRYQEVSDGSAELSDWEDVRERVKKKLASKR